MFSGIEMKSVPDGTEVKCPQTGEVFTVTDTAAVVNGSLMYVTPRLYEDIKAHPAIKDVTQPIKTGERL